MGAFSAPCQWPNIVQHSPSNALEPLCIRMASRHSTRRRTTSNVSRAPRRYDDPFLTAKAFQLMERLTSKREKLVSELMRTYVVTDEDLIALSQWAAQQVRGRGSPTGIREHTAWPAALPAGGPTLLLTR